MREYSDEKPDGLEDIRIIEIGRGSGEKQVRYSSQDQSRIVPQEDTIVPEIAFNKKKQSILSFFFFSQSSHFFSL